MLELFVISTRGLQDAFQEQCVIKTATKIIAALREAEKHLLAAMKTQDQARRIDLEKRAQLCLSKASQLEKQLNS